jgi:hypothetical protein
MTPTEWIAVASIIAASVTAIATGVLVVVTWILAKETKRLAEATSAPRVVATLEPSPWSIIHTNLVLQNAGTGTAYDIVVEFSPALRLNRQGATVEMAARSLSVLKPGSSFSVFLDGFEKLNEQVVDVRIAWSRAPSTGERESYSYRLDLIRDYDNWGQLGGPPPLIQIAQDMKKLREEVAKFARR